MPDQLLQRFKAHLAEAAVELVGRVCVAARDDVPMHRAQMLQQMRLLFEHRHAQSTRKRLLAGMHPQMRLQVPAHAELFTAI